ncbi:uncharacterized protein LOC127703036 [Mytilus californianus]|uniref:uncharacterized protein LOC127703036 n=1 Tax=Mytilus californianus TaxID=6549 RepID=UPI0022468333|nr:uncharacterized protein LOC127703036 [Mytilus californianus]
MEVYERYERFLKNPFKIHLDNERVFETQRETSNLSPLPITNSSKADITYDKEPEHFSQLQRTEKEAILFYSDWSSNQSKDVPIEYVNYLLAASKQNCFNITDEIIKKMVKKLQEKNDTNSADNDLMSCLHGIPLGDLSKDPNRHLDTLYLEASKEQEKYVKLQSFLKSEMVQFYMEGTCTELDESAFDKTATMHYLYGRQ